MNLQDSNATLSHNKGEVWVVLFWSFKYHPCQIPCKEMNNLVEKRKKDWGNNVKMISISIDQQIDKLKKYVED